MSNNNLHTKIKIIATIGPISENQKSFASLLHAGISVARTNMSHDDQVVHGNRIDMIRKVSKKENIPVAILQDLSGPKIRIGDFVNGSIDLIEGNKFILTGNKCIGDVNKVYFNYPYIEKDIKPGIVLILDYGRRKLLVEKVENKDVYTKVLVGGNIKNRRGVNIPGAYLSISAITKKDKSDLIFGIKKGVDFVALSFVRTAKDVDQLRKIIILNKGNQAIISKIETQEAVDHIDEIIASSDAIMVARGDLAIEIGTVKVPGVQKMIIRKCNEAGKPVIVATQMLESMINSPVPTRAEVSDAANAIFDGADAVMLSEETALGKNYTEAVCVMRDIAKHIDTETNTHRRLRVRNNDIVDSVSSSVVHNAEDISASAIIALTESGSTARMIARYKPKQPIIAITTHEYVARQMLLVYGCETIIVSKYKNVLDLMKNIGPKIIKMGVSKKNDRVVISAGIPIGVKGSTNMLMILTI